MYAELGRRCPLSAIRPSLLATNHLILMPNPRTIVSRDSPEKRDGTEVPTPRVQLGMDEYECTAAIEAGFAADDRRVADAIDRVKWDLCDVQSLDRLHEAVSQRHIGVPENRVRCRAL